MGSTMGFHRHGATPTLILLPLVSLVLSLHTGRIEALASRQASDIRSSTAAQPGRFDGPAELPRIYVDSSLRATPAPGKILTVKAGQDPSQVLSQATGGDTVELQAGASFDSLDLPAKNCDDSHWIII